VTYSAPARKAPDRIGIRRIHVVGLLAAIAAVAVALGDQSRPSSSSTARAPSTASSASRAAPPIRALRSQHRGAPGQADGVLSGSAAVSRHLGALGEADGAVPAGTTVFDEAVPGVAKLDPALLGALRRAATEAAADGLELVVNSGWRSVAYEEQLRREAIAKYGSEAEAARWVATGTTSPHVSGDAVDIGPANATRWLPAHGAAYGLCQIYGNEPWHYELRPEAIAHGCASMYADPTQDPRMQR
jgi:zinc D-Ala-D-Ala carboxypeptidase